MYYYVLPQTVHDNRLNQLGQVKYRKDSIAGTVNMTGLPGAIRKKDLGALIVNMDTNRRQGADATGLPGGCSPHIPLQKRPAGQRKR